MLVDKTYIEYLELLSSDSPAPGGGSVAAINGGLAASLIQMVCSLSIGKKGLEDKEELFKKIFDEVEAFKNYFIKGVDDDAKAFSGVIEAYKLAKSSEIEREYRNKAVQNAYKNAANVPYNLAIKAYEMVDYLEELVDVCNQFAVSDVSIAGMQLIASIEAAFVNVKINLSYIKDKDYVNEKREKMANVITDAKNRIDQIKIAIEKKF